MSSDVTTQPPFLRAPLMTCGLTWPSPPHTTPSPAHLHVLTASDVHSARTLASWAWRESERQAPRLQAGSAPPPPSSSQPRGLNIASIADGCLSPSALPPPRLQHILLVLFRVDLPPALPPSCMCVCARMCGFFLLPLTVRASGPGPEFDASSRSNGEQGQILQRPETTNRWVIFLFSYCVVVRHWLVCMRLSTSSLSQLYFSNVSLPPLSTQALLLHIMFFSLSGLVTIAETPMLPRWIFFRL